MRRIFGLLLLVVLSFGALAQTGGKVVIAEEDKQEKTPNDSLTMEEQIESYLRNENTYIKVSLTDYFGFEPLYGLSYSYPLDKGKARIDLGLAYMTYNRTYMMFQQNFDNFNISYHGVKAHGQIRNYYMSRGKERAIRRGYVPLFNDYIALDLAYKYGNSWYEDEFSMLGGQYFQRTSVLAHRHVVSANIIFGGDSQFFSKSNTLLDWYLGVGMRYKKIYCSNELISEEDYTPFFYDWEGNFLMFTTTFGVKLGIQLNR